MLLAYFKPPIRNTNAWKKKKFPTRRKVTRTLWGCLTFLRVGKEKILKKIVALAGGLFYSGRSVGLDVSFPWIVVVNPFERGDRS